MSTWNDVCALSDILPGTGVCALINSKQIALFRPYADERIFALDNIDPFALASVLSRGLLAEHDGELWVVSPLKKQRFRLRDGYCAEDESKSVHGYACQINEGRVLVDTQ